MAVFTLPRNGSGKSTLLIALRDSLIPGFPPSVRVLLVSQTEEDSSSDLKEGETSGTVLEKVIATDKKRMRAVREFEGQSVAFSRPSKSRRERELIAFDIGSG